MKYNYCTLFDSNYLTRALAMYESLLRYAPDFHLYIFAFDQTAQSVLSDLDLEHTTVIPLKDFEDPELLKVKYTRSQTEYCWTCTPSILLYAISRFGLDHCTYLDADLYFFKDPKVLVDEMETRSVLLTEHNYASQYDQTATSGKYCVQFMTFKNDATGIKALNWWRNACNEWCYERVENGKFGDQKYLDDWTDRFEGVHVLKHQGGGVAPWNIEKYTLSKEGGEFWITEKTTGLKWEIIFFHFHSVKMLEEIYSLFSIDVYKLRLLRISNDKYKVPPAFREQIYLPYLRHLQKIGRHLSYFGNHINFHAVVQRHRKLENRIQRLLTWKSAEAAN